MVVVIRTCQQLAVFEAATTAEHGWKDWEVGRVCVERTKVKGVERERRVW